MEPPKDTSGAREFSGQVAKWLHELGEGIKPVAKTIGWSLGAILLVAIAVSVYDSMDESGWITHNRTTPVWIQGDWMVGEYRSCQMRTKTVPTEHKDLDSLNRLPRLFCAEDANGLFDFQSTVVAASPPPADVKAPAPGYMYFIGVTNDGLDHAFHDMPVRYEGRIDRTDKWVIDWRCQRLSIGFLESAALECRAID